MISEKEIQEMPRAERLRLLEAIRESLGPIGEEYESPDWHRRELENTEREVEKTGDVPMDWEEAKASLLRKRHGA